MICIIINLILYYRLIVQIFMLTIETIILHSSLFSRSIETCTKHDNLSRDKWSSSYHLANFNTSLVLRRRKNFFNSFDLIKGISIIRKVTSVSFHFSYVYLGIKFN